MGKYKNFLIKKYILKMKNILFIFLFSIQVPVPMPQKEEPDNSLKNQFEDLMKRAKEKPRITKISNANILSIQEPSDSNTVNYQ